MYAVIKTGGKQERVKVGDIVTVEKLPGTEGESLTFSEVLLISNGEAVTVGTPTIANATVVGTILKQGKEKKITINKFKAKARYRRSAGHRQEVTDVKITEIKQS